MMETLRANGHADVMRSIDDDAAAGRSDGVIDVRVPQLGESVDVGTIVRWLKCAGDPVVAGEPLYEVSSDKAAMEVPAFAGGFLREILAEEGATIPVGAVVARIAAVARSAAPAAADTRERLSPVVRKLLREHRIDPAGLGRSKGGRITKEDVLAYLARAEALRPQASMPEASSRSPERASTALATPDAPLASSSARISHAVPAAAIVGEATGPSATNGTAGFARVPLSPLRRRAVERLTVAQKSSVNVFSVIEIDLEAVAAERARRKLSYLPFIARAVVDALRAVPNLNATFDEAEGALHVHDAVHLGIAVDLDEAGLVVPVIRDAQCLTVDGIAHEIERLAAGARAAALAPGEYAGATFTLTNNGGFGTLMTAPVINPPNVAIISTDAVELRPVIRDRAIAIRHRMYCCMTWDHRACDGSSAGRFLAAIKHDLENWDWAAQ